MSGLECGKWMSGREIIADPLNKKKKIELRQGGEHRQRVSRGCDPLQARRKDGREVQRRLDAWRLWEISVFPLTVLVMDVSSFRMGTFSSFFRFVSDVFAKYCPGNLAIAAFMLCRFCPETGTLARHGATIPNDGTRVAGCCGACTKRCVFNLIWTNAYDQQGRRSRPDSRGLSPPL